jgi:hypothetical protein
MTAAEHEALLAADPEYQARRRELDRQHAERAARLRAEEEPLVQDLAAIGFEVDSAWDLANLPNDYQACYRVLVDHFQRPYSDHVREGIARALTVPDAADIAWQPLRDAFVAIESQAAVPLKFVLGNALSVYMDESKLPEVFELVTNTEHGEDRAALVLELGDFNDREDVRRVLESLTEDPYIASQAKQALARKRRRRRRR